MLITKNIIVNPTLLPIIGESNKLTQELSKRFAKYYRRGIKKENRNKLLGYSLLIPKALSKLKSSFREDLMMIEVKVNKKSSILIPSYYTKAKTLRELFILENRKKLKSIYKLSNGAYKINLSAINESALGSLGTPSTTQKPGEEISLGFATDVKEKSINTWLEAELGERWYKQIAKGMTKGLNVLPGGGAISKSLDKVIDKVMNTGRFDKLEKSLVVDSYKDGKERMRAILVQLFEKSVGDEGKDAFINHACSIFSYNPSKAKVQDWGQKLIDIDANNLLQIEAKLNELLLEDMKEFIRISEGVVKSLGKKTPMFTIDKFKKKAHDVIDRVFEKYSIDSNEMSDIVPSTKEGLVKSFWRNTFKTIMMGLFISFLVGSGWSTKVLDNMFSRAEEAIGVEAMKSADTEIQGQAGVAIATSSQIESTAEDLRNPSGAIKIPGVEDCMDKIDKYGSDFVHAQEFAKKYGEIGSEQMHDLFVLSILKHIENNTEFGKLLISSAERSKDGIAWLDKSKEYADAAEDALSKEHSAALKEIYNSQSLIEGLIMSAARGIDKDFNIDALKSSKDFTDNDKAFLNVVFAMVSSSNIGKASGLIYKAGKIEGIKKLFGWGRGDKLKSATAQKMTAKYKEGLKEAVKEIGALAEECITKLKESGELDELSSQASVTQERIQKVAENSIETFGNWLAKFIPSSGRSSLLMKYYDSCVRAIYLEAYDSLLKNRVSYETGNKIKAIANNPKNLTRLTSLFMMMLTGLVHKWTRRDDIGTIGAEILRQNKQKNRIFKSMYAMNAIKTAQTIAYCSTIGGVKHKDTELVKKMGILNNELSCLVSVFEGDAHTGRFVIKYSSKSPSGSSNQLDGLLDDDDRSEGHLDPDAITFDPSHFESQGES